MPNTFTLIQAVTVGAGGATNITFSSIPQTYTDLMLYFSVRDNGGGVINNIPITFNGNTSNVYTEKLIYGYNSVVDSVGNSNTANINFVYGTQSLSTTNTFSNNSVYIPNYTGNTNKSVSIDSVTENNAATAINALTAGIWANTSAITSINLSGNTATFLQHSSAYLYGIIKS